MARLLLEWPRMKGWALVPLLASSGCLFLDGLNHAPSITISEGITSTDRGALLTVHPKVDDAEDGPSGVKVSYTITLAGSTAELDPRCDYDATLFGNDLSLRLFRAGIYEVRATAKDRDNAPAEAIVMLTIRDAPPRFADQSVIEQTTSRNYCKLNPAGRAITIGLTGSVGDADVTPIDCPSSEALTYTWRIKDFPPGADPALTAWDGAHCAPRTADSGRKLLVADQTTQVCLLTDPMMAGTTGMYTVVLDVFDGTNTTTSPDGAVPVVGNEPPCITGTDPVAGSYVVDRSQKITFNVEGAVDDTDSFGAGISFVWSVRRDSDATWSELPSWSLSTYELDPSSFGVGELVHVRVEAVDQSGTRAPASCGPTTADCIVPSCASMADACHKWKTWDLELR